MTVEKPKPKQLLRPITTGTNSAMNQSQFLEITCNSLEAREKSRAHGAIGFGFASDWLKNWRDSFKPITKRSNRNHVITFDGHLKTTLYKFDLRSQSLSNAIKKNYISKQTHCSTHLHSWPPSCSRITSGSRWSLYTQPNQKILLIRSCRYSSMIPITSSNTLQAWGPFLESPENFSGPKSPSWNPDPLIL